MKIDLLNEDSLTDLRAKMHRQTSRKYRSKIDREVIRLVNNKLKEGNSELSDLVNRPPEEGGISIYDAMDAMKAKRCIAGKTQDVGHTDVKQILGHIIRKIFPLMVGGKMIEINDARQIMGLPRIKV